MSNSIKINLPNRNNIWACCRNHPRTAELLKRVSLFKQQKNQKNWKLEALATQMVIIGVILVVIVGLRVVSSMNPNTALMSSSIHSDEIVCANLTCGGLYCAFNQPIGCDAQSLFLKLGETAVFCNTRTGCNWDVEVVTESNYDNRSTSLYIVGESGKISYFPQLEQQKRQFIDISKYTNTFGDVTMTDWLITQDTRSTSMPSCGSSHPSLLQPYTRCGSYNIYISSTVYDTDAKQKYQLELTQNIFWIMTSAISVYWLYSHLVYLYGELLKARDKAKHQAID